EVDPLAAEKQKINGWYEKIKSADFNMLGAGSNEYKQIVEKVEELKDYSDVNFFADSKGKVRTDILIEMHEKEAVIADKIQAYLDHKSEQFEKDPKRRDDPSKQKREQPRIKAALDVMADVKTDMAERTNAIVNTMQDKVRAKVEKMLENEGKVRSNPFVTHDEYVKSTYKSLNMINNLDGSNWSLGKNETLGHYVGRIKSYADPKTYDKSKKEIQNDRQNRTRNTLKEANKLFTDSGKRLTNEELKSKYVENTKTIKVYQNDIKKFDLNQAKTQIKEQSKKLKEALVAQPKKQAEKPASLAK
ncbi:MAG: hypothetical protein J6Z02_06780, partial [Lachnospiraceae bacterium]|nr:hypothetical protein [Lachnospiraceae bacterium]